MAVITTNVSCDLKEVVKVQYLSGNLFSQDNQANVINVTVTDGGEPATISGTVTANIIREDGGTVTATGGTISGNVVSITLPAAAYIVPGLVSIVVKLTASSVVTTLAAVVASVYQSSTETAVDPGTIIPSVTALVSQIETAVASIPADYSALWTSLAPAFSTSVTYAPGQYVTNGGALYVCTAAHTGSWVAGHFAATNLGAGLSELKSAIGTLTGSLPETVLSFVSGSINSQGSSATATNRIRLDSGYMQLINDGDFFYVDDLYKGIVRLYNSAAVSANTYYGVANGGEWENGAIPLKGYAGKYAVIVLQKVGYESSDISADVSTMTKHVSYISFPATIDKRFAKVDELNGYMQLNPTYTQGGFRTASANNTISQMTLNTDTNRARTNADKTYNSGIILPANTPIKIYADEGYQFAYQVYNSSGTAQDTFAFASGNLTITKTFEVSFFLMARKTNNGDITTAEAAQHIKIYIPIGTYKLDFNVSQSLTQQQKDIAKTNLGISDQGGIVTIPFEFDIPINIYKNAGKYQTDFNPHNNAITKANGVVVFLSPNGDDTDTGLSYTHPKKTIESALSVSNVATIIFASGTYTHGTHFTNGLTISADINFIADGVVIIDNGTGSPITFTGNVYCDGITFKGGDNAVITEQTASQTATFIRCVFCESDTLNGLALQGGKGFVFDCIARDNAYDGFSYHANGTVTGEYVEVNCEAYGNGTKYLTSDSGQSSNGTTSHDGCNIVRINGNYYSCHGGVVADKDCASANYGCSAGVSTITDSNYPDRMSNYWSSGANMYLYSCASYGSKYDTAIIRSGSITSDVEYSSNYTQ